MRRYIRKNGIIRKIAIYNFIFISLFIVPESDNISAETAEEYAVKAVFTLNIARYAKWPDGTFAGESSPNRLCVVGEKSIEPSFKAVAGKKIGSRELIVRFYNTPGDMGPCHMMFISRSVKASDVLQILEAVKGKPVLTLGETKKFIRQGGMINFFFKNGRLNFEINMDVVRQQKVKLSSRLLKLAILVGEK